MTLKPLPKTITDEIRLILEGCRDGRLDHKQSNYHCGTSHCIAGWKIVMDYIKKTKDDAIVTADFSSADFSYNDFYGNVLGEEIKADEDEWVYARKQWRLTESEAVILFRAHATFPEQFALLEKLERGLRVE